MDAAEYKFKYMTLSLKKDFDKHTPAYVGYLAIEFDYNNESSSIGQFFAASQENKILTAVKKLMGDKCQYSMEDWSILITPPSEEGFEMAPYLVNELKRIETDFDNIMEGN